MKPSSLSQTLSSVFIFVAIGTMGLAAVGCSGGSGGGGSAPTSPSPTATAAPTFSPAAGTYTSAQNVTLSDATAGATIYYTIDGSAPTTASTKYTAAIAVGATTTINAIAAASGDTTSGVASAAYSISIPVPVVATPTFSPAAGSYTAAQSVTIADATSGATIYYTSDGTTPTSSSKTYTAAIPVAATTTVKAIAALAGDTDSGVASATYTISIPVVAATPTFSPAGGSYTSAQSVTIADATAGTSIYYTTDGSTPTATSTLYAAPVAISAAGATTLQAIATGTGLTNSAIATATYTLTLSSATQPSYTYKNVPIVGGGFVDGLYFHPKQKGLMYAHTDIGGAYRWNDVAGGDTQWVPLMDFIGRFNSGFDLGVQSLAIDPSDATRLYLAIGDYTENYGSNGTVLASSDMGKTFTPTPLNIKLGGNDNGRNGGERMVVDPNYGQHIYLGTLVNGLYESNDRAATWHQVTSFPITGVNPNNAEDPESGVIFEQFVGTATAGNYNTKTVYFGVTSPTVGIYVSQDGGATFAAVPGQPTGYYPNAEALDAKNNILYVTYSLNSGCTQTANNGCDHVGPGGPNAGQVWSYTLPTSSNANGVWANITPPQTTPTGGAYGWDSVAVDPATPTIITVTTLNKYYPNPGDDLFRSADGGKTWYNLGTNEARDISAAPWMAPFEPGNWLCHLAIDPFDSNHAMYGNGQNIWVTHDLLDADGVATSTGTSVHGNKTTWSIGALGLEETDIIQLVSPPSGTAHLFSEMGDLGGFTHSDLTVSPAGGQQQHPLFTTGTSTDFAQTNPLVMARVGYSNGTAGTFNQPAGSLRGGYSTDGGVTWTQFASDPAVLKSGAGTVAVAADGKTIAWMPSDQGVAASYSIDNGTTWTASTGGPVQTQYGQIQLFSDRVNAKKFYLFDSTDNNGNTPIYLSTDGGHTFALASTPGDYDTGFAVSPNAEGDLWLYGYNGLFHSTDSGSTKTQISGVQEAFGIGFGMAAPSQTYPAIYFIGHVMADTVCDPSTTSGLTTQSQCIYRSVDGGKTSVLINDFNHQYGSFNVLTGDPRVFGRVYFGTGGRGIIEADSPY